MNPHNTYSLNALLTNQHIKPQVYDQLIHDIKSPLQEISVDITNDQTLNDSYLERRPPKRPDIPPPSKRVYTPIQEVEMGRTYQSFLYAPDSRELPKNHTMEAYLSPLDHQKDILPRRYLKK